MRILILFISILLLLLKPVVAFATAAIPSVEQDASEFGQKPEKDWQSLNPGQKLFIIILIASAVTVLGLYVALVVALRDWEPFHWPGG